MAKKKNFKSLSEYQEHLVKKRNFRSISEYKKHLAKQRGFKSHLEYQEYLAKKKNFKSLSEYKEHLAINHGFNSFMEYERFLAKERQKRTLNKKLSKIINQQLKILDKNASWLADELGITGGTVSRYRDGKITPRKKLQPKFFKILKLPYKYLEEL